MLNLLNVNYRDAKIMSVEVVLVSLLLICYLGAVFMQLTCNKQMLSSTHAEFKKDRLLL